MGRISIKKPFTMPREEVITAANKLGDWLKVEHNVDCQWQGDTAKIDGRSKGVTGTLSVLPDCIDLNLSLGMLASMFEKPLRDEIKRYLDKHVY